VIGGMVLLLNGRSVSAADDKGTPNDRDINTFLTDIRPILDTYCIRCHGADKAEAHVNFAAILNEADARKARRLWSKAFDQIKNGEMPPAEARQFAAADRTKLGWWLRERIESRDPNDRDPGPALVRRLSRPEYDRTLRDLLGIDFNASELVGIPDDSQGHGFANQSSILDLSPALMEKYFATTDQLLDRILVPASDLETPSTLNVAAASEIARPKPTANEPQRPNDPKLPPITKSTLTAQYKCAGSGAADNQIRPQFQIFNSGKDAVPLRELTIRYWFISGGETEFQHWCDYAKVDAKNVTRSVNILPKPVQDADAYVEVGFADGTLEAGGNTGEIQIRVAKQDWKPFEQTADYSFDASLTTFSEAPLVTLYRKGKLMWGREPSESAATSTKKTKTLQPAEGQPAKDSKTTAANTVEHQKMLKVRQAIFIAKPSTELSQQAAAKKIIESFARKAWRRPVQAAEVARLMTIYDRAVVKGADFTNAVRPMLKTVLVSPNFLFRIEQDRPMQGLETSHRVSDHELAVRLSYFIWSTLPDQELTALADQGKLSAPGELEKQAKRMLADPKSQALTENFAVPWLQLDNLTNARPATEFFPSFIPSLKTAMYQETTLFFDTLRQENRNLLELIDSDYTYVNEELARHYGISGVSGSEMRKISLKPEDHRGGLLGMGSVLASTSHTFRTSPTLRGKYVLEVILGTPPPPPPANVGVLKDEAKGKPPKTFRESLARHSTVAACAACHKKIDPLGFGLESFDAVGKWRAGDAATLDASGVLPTGEKFSGPDELKKLLLKRKDQFLRNLSEQMLTYALGRKLEDCDENTVLDIRDALKRDNNRFSTLILEVVRSFPFQHRRNVP